LEVVRADATLGEIRSVLRHVFGRIQRARDSLGNFHNCLYQLR
jgi:hypothetical protein